MNIHPLKLSHLAVLQSARNLEHVPSGFARLKTVFSNPSIGWMPPAESGWPARLLPGSSVAQHRRQQTRALSQICPAAWFCVTCKPRVLFTFLNGCKNVKRQVIFRDTCKPYENWIWLPINKVLLEDRLAPACALSGAVRLWWRSLVAAADDVPSARLEVFTNSPFPGKFANTCFKWGTYLGAEATKERFWPLLPVKWGKVRLCSCPPCCCRS